MYFSPSVHFKIQISKLTVDIENFNTNFESLKDSVV